MLIFPRVRTNLQLMKDAPPNTISGYNKSGYMTKELFVTWLHHFIKYSSPSPSNRVLLVLDGHSTHVKNIEAIDLATLNNVDIICLPPHTSHRMQPLDVSFMGPLKTHCNHEIDAIVRNREFVRLYELAGIFARAYTKAATPSIAVSGFRKTGIYPVNRSVFTDDDYAPSLLRSSQEIYLEDSRNTEQGYN